MSSESVYTALQSLPRVFTSTRSVTTQTALPSSIDRASAIVFLHDHASFQSLQPLLVKNEVVESPPSNDWLVKEANAISPPDVTPEYRVVTIRVPFGPWSSEIVTRVALINTEDGLVLLYQAPMGQHGTDQWRIIPADDGDGLVLVEKSIMSGFALLMPFAAGTKKQSHTEIGEAFIKKLAQGNE